MGIKSAHASIQVEALLGHPLNDIEIKFAPKMLYYAGSMEIPCHLLGSLS